MVGLAIDNKMNNPQQVQTMQKSVRFYLKNKKQIMGKENVLIFFKKILQRNQITSAMKCEKVALFRECDDRFTFRYRIPKSKYLNPFT